MLARNQITLTHRDSYNEPCSKNAVLPLEMFEWGHVWVQTPDGDRPCPDLRRSEQGVILDWPAIFDPRRLHATTPCTKGNRSVVIAFTPRNVNKLSVEDQLKLRALGFHF